MFDREMKRNMKSVSQRALARFIRRARKAAGLSGDVQVLITSSHHLRELNRHFRKKDKATDVLSFPAVQGGYRGKDLIRRNHPFAGDIAISAEIAAQQAEMRGHPLAHEIKVLILHGMLHLAGYDHETDDGAMARKEERLRNRLGLRECLIGRTRAAVIASRSRSRCPAAAETKQA